MTVPQADSALEAAGAVTARTEAAEAALTLVVPMRDEAGRFTPSAAPLARFVDRQPAGSELVFVDDGSADDTAALVQRFLAENPHVPARLIRRPPEGKGAAVRAGLASATTQLAGYCDVDLSTPLRDFTHLVDAARRAPVLAIGSRDLASSHITRHQARHREILGKLYNRAAQMLLVPGVVDTQCGAKVAQTAVWRELLSYSSEDGLAWDLEIVALARAFGVGVQELGVEWRHQDGSRVRPARDGAAMVRALTRIRRNVASATRRRASDATAGGGAFVGENAEALAEADATHWWFRSKAAFVSWAIRHHSDVAGRLVDLGAGAAGVTAQLGWPPGETVAVDASGFLVEQAHRRHPLHVVRGDTAAVPLADGAAHVVCLLDVIEHLADPGPALDEARRLLAADGILVVNVPAHPNLWSAADEVLGHARRYTRASLRDELERHGFAVTWMSHVFSWLYVPVWAKRRLRPGDEPQLGLDARSPLLSAASLVLTRLEWAVVSRAPLPVGTSVLCVARRASPTP